MAQEDSPKEPIIERTDTAAESDVATQETTETPEQSPQNQPDSEELLKKIESLEADLKAQQEGVLRARADAQNAIRRAERDVEHAHKFGLEKFTQELLPIVDNLERALEAAGDDPAVKPIREGVEMTLDLFVKALARFKIEQIDPGGEPFDPQHHQAMSIVENAEVEANTVVAVMQKGYTLNGRLVRPAMVVVSKASSAEQPKIDEQA